MCSAPLFPSPGVVFARSQDFLTFLLRVRPLIPITLVMSLVEVQFLWALNLLQFCLITLALFHLDPESFSESGSQSLTASLQQAGSQHGLLSLDSLSGLQWVTKEGQKPHRMQDNFLWKLFHCK